MRWALIYPAVHPRRYGELNVVKSGEFMTTGSSPQVRGTHLQLLIVNGQRRFIPAGTGNSNQVRGKYHGMAVHPRRYGELYQYRQLPECANGSSPQVRGTQVILYTAPVQIRFIPAGTGNSMYF